MSSRQKRWEKSGLDNYPSLGRFTQPDTLIPSPANPQSWNRFSYVLNNPVRFNDPSGHKESCEEGDVCLHSSNLAVKNIKYQRKCASGEDEACPGGTKGLVGFSATTIVIGGLAEYALLSGGVADILGSAYWNIAKSCISSAVCRWVTGAAGGANALSNQDTSLLGSGGGNNPRTGPIISRLTNRTTTYFRYWNTNLDNEPGAWVTTLETNNAAVAKDMLSLKYTPDAISKVTVPEGFRIQESLASSLFQQGGLGHQIELLDSLNEATFKFLGFLK